MAKADKIQVAGVEIAQEADAINISTGLDAVNDKGVVTVRIKAGYTPAFVAVYAGQHTTAGGDAAEQATVSGVLASDIVICSLEDDGTNNSTLISGAAAANAVNFVLNEDPGTDVIINYVVFRAVA